MHTALLGFCDDHYLQVAVEHLNTSVGFMCKEKSLFSNLDLFVIAGNLELKRMLREIRMFTLQSPGKL